MPQKNNPLKAGKLLIAIVEDDDSLRPALDGLVRSLGYDSETFASAEAFLSSGASARANCMVCDYQLPGLNGIDLAAKLQGALPVIIITARAEASLEALACQSGALSLLHKPFEAEELASCISSALDSMHT
jgi:FixJ family two-component response regulator